MKMFQRLTGSFHSSAVYRQARLSNNFGMGYALYVVALTTLVVMVYYGVFFHRMVFNSYNGQKPLFDSVVMQIADQVPVMTLKDGTLVTKDPVPTVIRLSGNFFGEPFENVPVITIDTSGTATHETMNTPVLVTHNEVMVKQKDKIEIKPLSEYSNDGKTILINRAVAQDFAVGFISSVRGNFLKLYLMVGSIGWFGLIVFIFIMRMFMLLGLGTVGLAIGAITKSPITYASAVGLASISYTPVALLDALMLMIFGHSPQTITLFLAGCVTLFVAMKCSEQPRSSQLIG